MYKKKLKIRFFEMTEYGVITAMCCESKIRAGKTIRNAVAFYTKPTDQDLRAAVAELERWCQHQDAMNDTAREKYIGDFIN